MLVRCSMVLDLSPDQVEDALAKLRQTMPQLVAEFRDQRGLDVVSFAVSRIQPAGETLLLGWHWGDG